MQNATFTALGSVWRAATILALVSLPLACSGPPEPEMPAGPHPIIILDIDSLRADHLGCYGYDRGTSPAIDDLAADSVRFEWAFTQSPSTAPAQGALLTGVYPAALGMVEEISLVPDEAVTLAEALAEAGYTTAAFVDGGYLSADFGFGQGFDEFTNARGGGMADIGPKAISWLRAHAQDNFLLLVHTYDPHVPYAPPAPHDQVFLDGLEPPSEGFAPTPEQLDAVVQSLATDAPQLLPENDLEYAKALYDGEIRHVDEWVGKILDAMRETGLDQRATLILVSDHGQAFQEHGSLLHEDLYANVTRVPLLVRLPGGLNSGVVGKNVELVDVVPTLLGLAGVALPPGVQGESLVPLIEGGGTPPHLAFAAAPGEGGERMVALGGYRLQLEPGADSVELFNLLSDPLEQQDLATTEEDRVVVLRHHLESWEMRVAEVSLGAEGTGDALAEDTLEQLKSLGYIQ